SSSTLRDELALLARSLGTIADGRRRRRDGGRALRTRREARPGVAAAPAIVLVRAHRALCRLAYSARLFLRTRVLHASLAAPRATPSGAVLHRVVVPGRRAARGHSVQLAPTLHRARRTDETDACVVRYRLSSGGRRRPIRGAHLLLAAFADSLQSDVGLAPLSDHELEHGGGRPAVLVARTRSTPRAARTVVSGPPDHDRRGCHSAANRARCVD